MKENIRQFKYLIVRWLAYSMLAFVVLSVTVVLPLRWIDPPITMVMIEKWWQSDSNRSLKQQWISWQNIPKQAALAVVTAEDQKFPHHNGFDINAIRQVLTQSDGKMRGASTISQQVAKNIYLWTGRSWLRKGLEAWLTLLIEVMLPKQRILELYLNIAEWGPCVFGIQAASYYHFGKPAKQLSSMQTALLASSLPSPLYFNPAHPNRHLREKARWNLRQQKKLGGLGWLASL